MVFVDTNILVDLFASDERVVSLASLKVDSCKKPLIISDAVLTEFCGLLLHNQRFLVPRSAVCLILQGLLSRKEFLFGGKGQEAIQLFIKHPKLDMVDCLVACYGNRKTRLVLTNDSNLKRILA